MKHQQIKINLFSFVKWKICDIWNDPTPAQMRLKGNVNQWVYLIYNPCNGLTKIGRSNDVHRRHTDLTNASGCPLEIIAAIELIAGCDPCDKLMERVLHDYYHSKRVQGEWFRLSILDIFRIRTAFNRMLRDNTNHNILSIYAKYKAAKTEAGNGEPHNRQRPANDKFAAELRRVSGE